MKTTRIWLIVTLFVVLLACTIPTPPASPPRPTREAQHPTLRPTHTPRPTPTLYSPLPTPMLSSPLPTPESPPTVRLDASVNLDALSATAPFMLHFSTPMDTTSTPHPLVLVPPAEGRFLWDDTATLLMFFPKSPLEANARIEFAVSRALNTLDGRAIQGSRSWQATVAYAPTVTHYRLFDRDKVLYESTHLSDRYPHMHLAFSRALKMRRCLNAGQLSQRY